MRLWLEIEYSIENFILIASNVSRTLKLSQMKQKSKTEILSYSFLSFLKGDLFRISYPICISSARAIG